MARVAEESTACDHGVEDAGALFEATIALNADGRGEEARDRLGAMDVD